MFSLPQIWSALTKWIGTGNDLCVSRAVLFAYLENLTYNLNSGSAAGQAEYDRILKVIQRSKEDLVNVGYSEFAVEDFHEVSSVTSCSFTAVLLHCSLSVLLLAKALAVP